MRESVTKSTIIRALYFYMVHANFEEQVDCLQQFACEPYKSVTLETDPDKRAQLFEDIINDAVRDLDEVIIYE